MTSCSQSTLILGSRNLLAREVCRQHFGEALEHLQTGDEDKQSHSFSILSKPPRGSNQSSDTFGYVLITGSSQTNSSGH